MLDEVVRDQIRSEIEQIQDIFVKFDSLLSKSETEEQEIEDFLKIPDWTLEPSMWIESKKKVVR